MLKIGWKLNISARHRSILVKHQLILFKRESISFIVTSFGCTHITWSFNLNVSFTFQPIPCLEINDLRVSLDKFLILGRYLLLEAELRWFYYSLSFYIKQEIQHSDVINDSWFLMLKMNGYLLFTDFMCLKGKN